MMSRRYIRLGGLVILLCSFAAIAFGQASFTATVDNDHVSTGDQIQLTFTLNSANGGVNFRPPAMNDFLVLSGPNQSTNMQFVNGSVSSSVSYGFVVQPRAAGTFTIGPAIIDYGGKQLTTQPIKIVVSKGAPPPKGNAQQGGAANGAPNADINKQIGDNVFVRTVVDKAKAYQGEQILLTYKLYYRINVGGPNIDKLPALTGFWNEDFTLTKATQNITETVNGKQYNVFIIKKSAIFPQRSGILTIDPLEAKIPVQVRTQRRTNDIFDQFINDPIFGGVQNVNYPVHTDPVKITVLPLPSENVPEGFNGAVGKYTMESWIDKKAVKTGEAVTLRIKVTGRGNLKLLEAPTVNVSPDIERYDPKISDNITTDNNIIGGSRTFEYLLIPRNPGEQRIASLPFSYFDIESKSYKTYHTPEFVLNVEKGAGYAASNVEGVSKEDVKLLGEDIRFIKSGNAGLRRKGDRLAGSP